MAGQDSVSLTIGALIVGLVLMFVGLFMVDAVSQTFTTADLYTCTWVSTENTTLFNLTNQTTGNRTFAVTTFSTRCNYTDGAYLYVSYYNVSSTWTTINVSLNGNFVQTIPIGTNETNQTARIKITPLESTTNYITYRFSNTTYDRGQVNISSDAVTTSATEALSSTGQIWTQIVTLVGTVFGVLGLVLIVVALAMAIAHLRGMTTG